MATTVTYINEGQLLKSDGTVHTAWQNICHGHDQFYDAETRAMKVPKMRVTFSWERRRWEVWEDYGGTSLPKHHSWHRTESDARSVARAQAKQDKADAAASSR